MLFHSRPNGLPKSFDVVAAGIARVDQEIAVHFGDLSAANPQAPASRGVDQLPGALARRVLERRAAGLFANRLRGFAVVLHLVHALPDPRRGGDLPPKPRRGKYHRAINAAVAIAEFHVGVRKHMLVAIAADAHS